MLFRLNSYWYKRMLLVSTCQVCQEPADVGRLVPLIANAPCLPET